MTFYVKFLTVVVHQKGDPYIYILLLFLSLNTSKTNFCFVLKFCEVFFLVRSKVSYKVDWFIYEGRTEPTGKVNQ